MRVAIAQIDVAQGEFEQNLLSVESYAKNARLHGAEIVVFPEMFLCGFNYKKNVEFLRANGTFAE